MAGDPDDVRFLDILKGAGSGSEGPDIALAELLIDLDPADPHSGRLALEKLARDARQG
jgi:hypothetical protein